MCSGKNEHTHTYTDDRLVQREGRGAGRAWSSFTVGRIGGIFAANRSVSRSAICQTNEDHGPVLECGNGGSSDSTTREEAAGNW